tara:strand:+ start:163 stop:678 length:516 start_codon:yes stop_codon:yes gene_type:complete
LANSVHATDFLTITKEAIDAISVGEAFTAALGVFITNGSECATGGNPVFTKHVIVAEFLSVTIKCVATIRSITTFATHIAFFIAKGLLFVTGKRTKVAKPIIFTEFNAITKRSIDAIGIFKTGNAALGSFNTNRSGAAAGWRAGNALMLRGTYFFTVTVGGVITIIGEATC